MSVSSDQPCSSEIWVSWPKSSSRSTEDIVYSKYAHQLLKDIGTNVFTLQPSQLSPQIRTFLTTSIILVLAVYSHGLLRFSFLHDLLPSWLKRFVAIPSNSDRSYTSSSRNTSLLEVGSSSPVSHESPVNSLTGYVPGITVLPSPPPAFLSTPSKSAVHGYQVCEPFSFNRTSPIPRQKTTSFDNNTERLPALHKPPIFFSSTSDMHAAYQPMKSSSQYITMIITFSFGGPDVLIQ